MICLDPNHTDYEKPPPNRSYEVSESKRLFTSMIIPIDTKTFPLVSEENTYEQPCVKTRRKKLQQHRIKLEFLHKRPYLKFPCEVHLTRYAKKKMDDDNFIHACKAIRDQIADCLIPGLQKGQADGCDQITWHYKQEIAKNVHLKIELRA
jgi:hypothetical protein